MAAPLGGNSDAAERGAPDDVQGHFGWIGAFFGMDLAATSTATREQVRGTAAGFRWLPR